jgi:hypothetical protein
MIAVADRAAAPTIEAAPAVVGTARADAARVPAMRHRAARPGGRSAGTTTTAASAAAPPPRTAGGRIAPAGTVVTAAAAGTARGPGDPIGPVTADVTTADAATGTVAVPPAARVTGRVVTPEAPEAVGVPMAALVSRASAAGARTGGPGPTVPGDVTRARVTTGRGRTAGASVTTTADSGPVGRTTTPGVPAATAPAASGGPPPAEAGRTRVATTAAVVPAGTVRAIAGATDEGRTVARAGRRTGVMSGPEGRRAAATTAPGATVRPGAPTIAATVGSRATSRAIGAPGPRTARSGVTRTPCRGPSSPRSPTR